MLEPLPDVDHSQHPANRADVRTDTSTAQQPASRRGSLDAPLLPGRTAPRSRGPSITFGTERLGRDPRPSPRFVGLGAYCVPGDNPGTKSLSSTDDPFVPRKSPYIQRGPAFPRSNSDSRPLSTADTMADATTLRNMSFYDYREQDRTNARRAPGNPSQSYANVYRSQSNTGAQMHHEAIHEEPRHHEHHHHRPWDHLPHGLTRRDGYAVSWQKFLTSDGKNNIVASLGEFLGTTMFLLLAFSGAQVANVRSQATSGTLTNADAGFSPIVLLYISMSFGFSLMVNVWVFFRISGGLFNPAVTLALLLVRAIRPLRALCLFIAQIAGSIAASALVIGLFPERLNVQTTLGQGTSTIRGVFIEAFLTAELVFTILMLAKEQHRATFIAPMVIGFSLFIIELAGVFYTGGSVNPARSFGPAVLAGFDNKHWIYWVGPGLGSLMAVTIYQIFKLLEYEMANPGQDADPENNPTLNPDHELRRRQRVSTARLMERMGSQSTQSSVPVSASRGSYGNRTIDGADLEKHPYPSPRTALDHLSSASPRRSNATASLFARRHGRPRVARLPLSPRINTQTHPYSNPYSSMLPGGGVTAVGPPTPTRMPHPIGNTGTSGNEATTRRKASTPPAMITTENGPVTPGLATGTTLGAGALGGFEGALYKRDSLDSPGALQEKEEAEGVGLGIGIDRGGEREERE